MLTFLIKPFSDALKKENTFALLVIALVAAVIAVWVTLWSVQEKCDKEAAALHAHYGIIIVAKDSVILATKQENIDDKEEQIRKLEARANRNDSFILDNNKRDARLVIKTDRNNEQSKVIKSKLSKTVQ